MGFALRVGVRRVTPPNPARTVMVCRHCSQLYGQAPVKDACDRHDWLELPLVEDGGVETSIVNPHPDAGWPEIRVTMVYLVHSDDPAVIETERRRLFMEAVA